MLVKVSIVITTYHKAHGLVCILSTSNNNLQRTHQLVCYIYTKQGGREGGREGGGVKEQRKKRRKRSEGGGRGRRRGREEREREEGGEGVQNMKYIKGGKRRLNIISYPTQNEK